MNDTEQNLQNLADKLGIDDNMLKEILILFFENMPGQIVAMRDDIAKHNAPSVYIISHTLKGTAANLHYHEISKAAAEIEVLAKSGSEKKEDYEALFNKLSLQLSHAKMKISYK